MIWSSMASKWPIMVIFCGMDDQKSKFLLIYGIFYATFLKIGWWKSNIQISRSYKYLQTQSYKHISICQAQITFDVSI
jgi:hypothetical protein